MASRKRKQREEESEARDAAEDMITSDAPPVTIATSALSTATKTGKQWS